LNAESETLHEGATRRPSETVAGFLAAMAIFMSIIGIAWHPLRLILPSTAIALVAAGMAGPGRSLPRAAVLICAVCLFFGFTVAVVTSHALW
jgi:hypothetical protein